MKKNVIDKKSIIERSAQEILSNVCHHTTINDMKTIKNILTEVYDSGFNQETFRQSYVGDPVFRVQDQWFFYDEVWVSYYGPYSSEEECDDKLKEYGKNL